MSLFCLTLLLVRVVCPAELADAWPRVRRWQDCYNGFLRHLNAGSPLGKRIPADIAGPADIKNEPDQANAHLGEVYERVAQDAKVTAKLVPADYAAWRDAARRLCRRAQRYRRERARA